MDLSNIDMKALARQLRKPEGDYGEEVGRRMVEFNTHENHWMLEMLGINPTDHVLEIGFGPGETLAEIVYMTPEGFAAGIDYSETMMKMAELRNARAIIQDKLEIHIADASQIPYPDETFDKVCAANVLYFWSDLAIPFREIKRVLKPSGKLALYFTDSSSWIPGMSETGVFHAYTPENIESALQAAGFTEVRIHPRMIPPEGKGYCAVATSE